MKIQVVLGEVRKRAHGKAHRADPLQHQGVGGDLHHRVGAAGVPHPGEQAVELKALGGGALGVQHLVADHVLDGADEPHLRPQGLLQHALEQIRAGGLAVGAGNADDGQAVRRMAEPVRAELGQGQAGGIHQHIGAVLLRDPLADHAGRALLQGGGDEPVPVGGKAGDGHEECPFSALAGVIAHVRDLKVRIGVEFANVQALQQLLKTHSEDLLCMI